VLPPSAERRSRNDELIGDLQRIGGNSKYAPPKQDRNAQDRNKKNVVLDDVIYKVTLSCVNLKVIKKRGSHDRCRFYLIPPGMVGFVLLHDALIPQTLKQYLRTLMKAVII
jgi:hypothetical protein